MLCSRPQLLETSSGSLILLLGDQRISAFAWKSYAGYPGFHRYRALGTLEFFLEHSLVYCGQCRPIYRPIQLSIQRSTVGRYSGRQSVDSRSIVSRSWGRLSAEHRSIFRRHTPTDYRSTVGGISVNCRSNISRVLIQQVSPMAFFLSNDVINYCYHAMGDQWHCEVRLPYEANRRALGTRDMVTFCFQFVSSPIV